MVRKYLILLLLAMLPYQFVWGAVAAYCNHESGVEVSHFGHHTHKHKNGAAQSSSDSKPETAGSPFADDDDCSYCHQGCTKAIPASAEAMCTDSTPRLIALPPPILLLVIPAFIERPDWTHTL